MESDRSVTPWRTVMGIVVGVGLLVGAVVLFWPTLTGQVWLRLVPLGFTGLWFVFQMIGAARRQAWRSALMYSAGTVLWGVLFRNALADLSLS